MGRSLTTEPPIFFVCGTPSDRHGFDYIVLDGHHLPSSLSLARCIDSLPKEKFPAHGMETHAVYRIETDGLRSAIYAEYRWIHPNDTEHNRGAYIAVGCWAKAPLTTAHATRALQRIKTVHDHLTSRRNPKTDTFPPDFQLRDYTAPTPTEGSCGQFQLVDLLCQAVAGNGAFAGPRERLIRTSDEIRQGFLEEFCVPAQSQNQAPPHPNFAGRRSWHAQLHDVLQDAMREAPRTSQAISRLSRLEEERTRIITALIQNTSETPRVLRQEMRRPPMVPQDALPMGDYGNLAAKIDWRFTTRDIVFSAIGIVFGLIIGFTVIISVRHFFEEDQAVSQPIIEKEITPSPQR